MITMILRIIRIALRNIIRAKKFDVLTETSCPMKCMPLDSDFNNHLNNASYLKLMDFGRWDHSLKIRGYVGESRRRRWKTVVASSEIHYLRSIKTFRKFDVTTQIVFWDEKYIYHKHRFIRKNKLMAVALIKSTIIGKRGLVPPATFLKILGHTEPSPPVTPLFENDIKKVIMDETQDLHERPLEKTVH